MGTVVGAYEVEARLGHGGYSVVYRARHVQLEQVVALKEYFPADLAVREGGTVYPRSTESTPHYEDGKRRFLEEAKCIAQFKDDPGVVACLGYFSANGTAYIVLEHVDGLSLAALLREREAAGRPLDESELRSLVLPLLESLERLHAADVLHRDIKPSNILLRRGDGRPVLIDFGAAKQQAALHSKSVAPYTEGYAALEQVGAGKLGPWTDVYAIGAVMWRVVAGSKPPWQPPNPTKVEIRAAAVLTGEADPLPSAVALGEHRFSPDLLAAIDNCLKIRASDRVPACSALRHSIEETASTTESQGGPSSTPRNGWTIGPTLVIVTLISIILVLIAVGLEDGETPSHSSPDSSASSGETQPAARTEPWLAGEVFRDCRGCPEMVVIPGGRFRMGCVSGDRNCYQGEYPVREVEVASFALGVYEVMFEEYDRFASATGRALPDDEGWGRGGRPVINVNWDDAQAYVEWLSAESGAEYRLPSEAEWEYAARAGTETAYWWGSEIGRNRANCFNCGSAYDDEKTGPAGSFAANGWGLHDMAGNVWEWVEDCGHENYARAPSDGSAWLEQGDGDCGRRVLRGGSWVVLPMRLRSAARAGLDAGLRNVNIGLRVSRTLD